MATNFPDTTVNNPDTGRLWADGDSFSDTETGLIYYWHPPVWKTAISPTGATDAKYVEVLGDNMTGDLTLGPDGGPALIELNATTGSAEVNGLLAVETPDMAAFSIGQDIDGSGQNHLGIYYGDQIDATSSADIFTSNGDIRIRTDGNGAVSTGQVHFINGFAGGNEGAVQITPSTGDVQLASQNGGPLAGFRNQIINGDFRVAQRGETFSSAEGELNQYTLDRWYGLNASTSIIQASIIAGGAQQLPGFSTGISATTGLNLRHGIELDVLGTNSQFPKNSQWTLSYWSNQPFTAVNAGFSDSVGTLANDSYFSNIDLPIAIETNGGWTRYRKTITIDQDTALTNTCLIWIFVNTNSVSHTMTGVQFEPGPVATPFEHRPYGTELALCQRYFYKGDSIFASAQGTTEHVNNRSVAQFFYPVTMRTTPTVSGEDYLNSTRAQAPSAGKDRVTFIPNPTSASNNALVANYEISAEL